MTTSDDLYQTSARRDAWRAQLLHEQVAEEMAARRNAASMRVAVAIGVALGLLGSFWVYLP
jgi:hypothetical protein